MQPDKEQSPSVTELKEAIAEALRKAAEQQARFIFIDDSEVYADAVLGVLARVTRPTPDLGKDGELCDELREGCYTDGCSETKEQAAERLEALHAEREKLREAVGAFLICIHDLPKDSLARKAFSHVENLSRAALSIGEPLTDSSHGGEK